MGRSFCICIFYLFNILSDLVVDLLMFDCLIYSVVVDEILVVVVVVVVGVSANSFLHFIGKNAFGWKPQFCKKYQGKNATILLQSARFLRAATQLN